MEALPKIVRQRLRSGSKLGGHPQADLLTAFAEQSLTDRERSRVVEHLSRCEDCREVVFLASVQQDPDQVVTKVPAHGGWLSWPVLRWGAAVACVVVVGAAVTLHRQGESRPQIREQLQARSETSLTALSVAPKETPEVARQQRLPMATRSDVAEPKKSVDQDKLEARLETPPRPRAMSASPSLPMQFDQSRQINRDESGNTGASVGGPISNQVVATPALRAKAGKDEALEEDYKKQELADRSVATNKPSSQNESVEVEASASATQTVSVEPSSPSAMGKTVGAVAGSFAKSEKTKADSASTNLRAHWMLTSGGSLQRSFNSRNWETVSVAEGVAFQAFAAVLAEVWVGGAKGILYHSSDAGLHWVQVVPKANGEVLGSGIVQIEFSDVANGKLTSDTGEIWTTSDAGKTWLKN
jgi:hypothetical protein